ncbi:MAG TPA: protein kinase, partial [Thermoanaerobaculia bacterium]|nr:protein kinase [Thermoanaerobaculia bacterium]
MLRDGDDLTLAPGSRLGPYEVLAKLGEGGMGEVYRARDTKLRREVAIKVLPESVARDREWLARFEREAKVLASLNHPNIAQIYGLEEGNGAPALVMELVSGPTLAERMAGMAGTPLARLENGARVMPLEETLSIARQIAEALEDAHEKGIIHRDLKPENVKVTTQGRVKVLDFGLAKALGSAGDEMTQAATQTLEGTRQGVVMGTAAYMSPEQAQGAAVDRRTDIWSFGVILYEMLCGERLFHADSFMETLSAVLHREIDFDRVPATVPSGVRRLLRRCLERDPRRRLRDIGEARVALEDALSGGGDEAVTAQVPGLPRAPARRGVKVALVLGAVLSGALLGSVLTGWLSHPPAPEPIRIHALTYSGTDSDPAASPDGKLVAFTSRRDGRARIWIKQMVGGGEAPLTSGPDGLARFSPDGSSLLFVRDLGTTEAIYRTALIGGEERRVIGNASEADWSPDGQRIVFVRNRAKGRAVTQLGTFDLATGREKIVLDLTNLGNLILRSPRWSPDGRTIAFASGTFSSADWKLQTLDLASGRLAEIP